MKINLKYAFNQQKLYFSITYIFMVFEFKFQVWN